MMHHIDSHVKHVEQGGERVQEHDDPGARQHRSMTSQKRGWGSQKKFLGFHKGLKSWWLRI